MRTVIWCLWAYPLMIFSLIGGACVLAMTVFGAFFAVWFVLGAILDTWQRVFG